MKSIELLVSALNDTHDSEITIQSHEDTTLYVLLNLQRVDGKIVPYQLKINATQGAKVVVSEVTPQLLPVCCPERHINSDGTFCLYWEDDIDLGITTIDKATLWWQTLISFLLKQERAKKKREWPDKDAWAHGSAAEFQRSALSALDQIGVDFKNSVMLESIQVTYHKANKGNGSYYKVLKNGLPWYIVWEKFQRIALLRQKCLCGSNSKRRYKNTLRNCSKQSHQKYFVDFAINFYHWKTEEAAFWAHFKGKSCCGTLDECPLNLP